MQHFLSMKSKSRNQTYLRPSSVLGVIGGGQLGRMFAAAARRLGYRVAVLAATEDDPAAQAADWTVVGPSDHLPSLKAFAEKVDAVTVEFENVSAASLRSLERAGLIARPGWKAVRVSQNRLREKTFLRRGGFLTTDWRPIRTLEELRGAFDELGLPAILKTASSGYDGKGQIRVDTGGIEGLEAAWAALGRTACVLEKAVEFAAELSVVVARGSDGEATAYPPAWNRHERHILDSTVMPAPFGPVVAREAGAIALEVAAALEAVGVLTVEFFLTASGTLLVNEIAPRPHNSGHLTIEAAVCDQFEQQVRALCGLPLGLAELRSPAAMVNLLGDLWRDGEPNWLAALRAEPAAHWHLYGKKTARPGRKMGHLTVLDADPHQALERASAARGALTSHEAVASCSG